MADIAALLKAYTAIQMAFLRREITREERNARTIALRDTEMAAGLTFEERDKLVNKAVEDASAILDEMYFSESRRWQ